MKRVTKKLPVVVAIATALSLSFVTVHQSGVIQGLKKTLGITESKLDKSEKALAAERELTKSLHEEKAILEDSIEVLNLEVAKLNEKIADHKATINYQSKKIKKLDDNVKGLSRQLAELKKKRNADQSKIQKLEDEIEKNLIKMEGIDRERIQAMKKIKEVEKKKQEEARRLKDAKREKEKVEDRILRPQPAPLPKVVKPRAKPPVVSDPKKEIRDEVDAEVKTREQERIRKIVTGTTVKFMDVKLSMKAGGKPLDKLKKEGWKETSIKVDLANADHDAIIDEEFIVQVFDLDNNKVVPVNESNIQYPDSHRGALGYKFNYEGKALTINYFNSQKKLGSNYELRLFYAKSGILLPLKNGTLRIVKDGKVM